MKAIILAAGRGERMRPLTDAMPKPLLQVGGQPLIDYHIRALVRAGVRDIVVNLAWRKEELTRYLGDGERYDAHISYSDEGDHALETGGGIFRALDLLGPGPFWVVNGDIHAEFDFAPRPLEASCQAHLVLVPNPGHNPAGDFALTAGRVQNTGEPMFTYSGIALLSPALFAGCTDGIFPLAPLLRSAADAGQISGELLEDGWCDVGTPARLRELDARLTNQAGNSVLPS